LLPPDEAAEFLGITPRALQYLWSERRIAAVKVGRAVRYRIEDLIAFSEANRVDAVA
jgi:excisionase family DNA binding protein